MLSGKDTIIRYIPGQIKKAVEMIQYFPKPNSLGPNVKSELDSSSYTTKADLKKATRVGTSSCFTKKTDLAKFKKCKLKNIPTNLTNLKIKLDVDKLLPVPVGLKKLCDIVKSHFVKKTEYKELVKKSS